MITATFMLGIYDYEADAEFAARLRVEAVVPYIPEPSCDSTVVIGDDLDAAVVQSVALDLPSATVNVGLMIYAKDVPAAVEQLVAGGWQVLS